MNMHTVGALIVHELNYKSLHAYRTSCKYTYIITWSCLVRIIIILNFMIIQVLQKLPLLALLCLLPMVTAIIILLYIIVNKRQSTNQNASKPE